MAERITVLEINDFLDDLTMDSGKRVVSLESDEQRREELNQEAKKRPVTNKYTVDFLD